MHANDPDVYPEIYRVLAFGDRELSVKVSAIRSPTLVLTCQYDSGSPPDMAEAMARVIPNAQLAVAPGLKHMGLLEDPGAINKILLPFLTG
jgi:pimeloyl-ACP methyl ester carboxylesterase